MKTRSGLVAAVALALVGGGGYAAAATLAADDAPAVPAAVERVHAYYRAGPSAEYDGDSGGIGEVRPLRFVVPEGGSRVGVAELSFHYRTRGAGPFYVSVNIGDGADTNLTVRPDEQFLAPAPDGGTATVRFLPPELAGGDTYAAYPAVNSAFPGGARKNVIRTNKVLLTVDLTPR
ncbi:hypothetical protein H5V45_12985 [Nocardioides sp. KIGAM211]|uniref:Uncharacterized protein n=1 Tax=Nocardioides luti TaxID=2761101 RepID=A0A7X0RH74_9ACTN|nr:hypothetical protein [Nocardioides luti]MBB6628236.1 hypothetical protein [Nocardioides luti]